MSYALLLYNDNIRHADVTRSACCGMRYHSYYCGDRAHQKYVFCDTVKLLTLPHAGFYPKLFLVLALGGASSLSAHPCHAHENYT